MSSNPGNELVLITGCNGFIASWLCKLALKAGFRVRGTVRDPTNEHKTKYLRELPGASERLELIALDLVQRDEAAFAKAVEGVTLIAHTASPFPDKTPDDENDLIIPAVQGTVGILKAALHSPTVRRVVVTSSVAAIGGGIESGETKNDKDWNDVATATPYPKSKTLAEKAAWDLWNEQKPKWSLCTVNPGFVLGPSIGPDRTTSAELGIRMLNGNPPLVPKMAFTIVDVRDVAKAHLQCLVLPDEVVSGKRFIVVNESKWMTEMCQIMRETFQPLGYNVPKYEAPYFLVWIASLLDATLRVVLPNINKITYYDNTLSKELLKIEYTDIRKTFSDYGHALIYHGLVQKSPSYAPPRTKWAPVNSDDQL